MFLFLQFLTTSNAYVIGGNPSLQKFSSSFAEPTPPLLVSEFSASWNQHKWDENVSHIASGFLYNSAANKKVRVDEAYNSTLASSLFDFTKVTSDGLVLNDLFTIAPSIASKPVCQQFMANPAFPLVPSDFLTASEAVFAGEAEDEFNGLVQLVRTNIPIVLRSAGDQIVDVCLRSGIFSTKAPSPSRSLSTL
ncbi:MAG: hypothetical protein MMC33_010164 [Icmadophila ericetorum]|nr:hypothetical protein [Icmadophila ericetorum]